MIMGGFPTNPYKEVYLLKKKEMKKTLKESLIDINNMMSRIDHPVILEQKDFQKRLESEQHPNTTLKHDDEIKACINCLGNKPGYIEGKITKLYGDGLYGIFITKLYQAPHNLLKGYYILNVDDNDLTKAATLEQPSTKNKWEIGESGQGISKI